MATKRVSRKSSGKVKAGGGLGGSISKAVVNRLSLGTPKGIGYGRKRHGVEYWAKKVLVERLKKKYFKTKYGSIK
jgi:hypothetical protein